MKTYQRAFNAVKLHADCRCAWALDVLEIFDDQAVGNYQISTRDYDLPKRMAETPATAIPSFNVHSTEILVINRGVIGATKNTVR